MGTMVLFVVIILILVDIFLAYEIPTQLAYILLTAIIVVALKYSILHKLFIGVLIWFTFLVFHYLIWRKLIEKIHDKIISPQKHTGGIEGLIGESGTITKVNGKAFMLINEELYEFKNETNKEVVYGEQYRILRTASNKLII